MSCLISQRWLDTLHANNHSTSFLMPDATEGPLTEVATISTHASLPKMPAENACRKQFLNIYSKASATDHDLLTTSEPR